MDFLGSIDFLVSVFSRNKQIMYKFHDSVERSESLTKVKVSMNPTAQMNFSGRSAI